MQEVFDLQFKNSIYYGMTYEQFWFYDPQLYYIYEEVYLDKLKEKDALNWQLGQYIQIAICASFDEKGRCKYPETPMFYARENDKPKDVFDMRDKFIRMVEQINKNFD